MRPPPREGTPLSGGPLGATKPGDSSSGLMPDLMGGQGPSLGVDAVTQADPPAVRPQQSIYSTPGTDHPVDPNTAHYAHAVDPIKSQYPEDLQRFGRQQLQPDREPIMNALGLLSMIGNSFLPRSQLASNIRPPSPMQQAPEIWQRPPVLPEGPQLSPSGAVEGTLTRGAPTIPESEMLGAPSLVNEGTQLGTNLQNQPVAIGQLGTKTANMRPPALGQPNPDLFQRPPVALDQPSALPFQVRPSMQPNPFGAEMPPMSNQSSLNFGAPSQFIDSVPMQSQAAQSMRPPPTTGALGDTQISNTMIYPKSMTPPESMPPSMESMIPPPTQPQAPMQMQQPNMMQQGNASLLEQFNNLTPQQQLEVLTTALGIGVGGGIGYGMMNKQQQQPPQQPSWFGVPEPRAIQR